MKLAGLPAVGFFIALIVYPVLHEGGHWLMTLLVGGRVESFRIFPVPNVLCNVTSVSVAGRVAIGFGGILLPALCCPMARGTGFWLRYSGFVLKGICLLSFLLSAVAAVCFLVGNPIANEDMTQILILWPEGALPCLSGSLGASAVIFRSLRRDRLFSRCISYFDSPKKTKANAT